MQPQRPGTVTLQQQLNNINHRIVKVETEYKKLGLEYHFCDISDRDKECARWPEEIQGAWTIGPEGQIPKIMTDLRELGDSAKQIKRVIEGKPRSSITEWRHKAEFSLMRIKEHQKMVDSWSIGLVGLEYDIESEANNQETEEFDYTIYEYPMDDPNAPKEAMDEEPDEDKVIIVETTSDYRYRLDRIDKMPVDQRKEFIRWVVELNECQHALKHGIIKRDENGELPVEELIKYAFGRNRHVRVPVYCRICDAELAAEEEDEEVDEGRENLPFGIFSRPPFHFVDGQEEARFVYGGGAAVQFL